VIPHAYGSGPEYKQAKHSTMDDLDGNADGKARKRKATAAEEAQARYCIHLSELQDLDIVLIRSRVQLNGVRMGYTVLLII